VGFQKLKSKTEINCAHVFDFLGWFSSKWVRETGSRVLYFPAGLPDGLFSDQKSGYILEGLGMVNVGIFYDHLEYFTSIWYIIYGRLVWLVVIWYFFPIWYVWNKKNLATLLPGPLHRFHIFHID
jgi:hypothetical protein